MGLADQLRREAQDREIAVTRARADSLVGAGRLLTNQLARNVDLAGLDLKVVYLDSATGTHPVLRRQQFGGYELGSDYHTLHRAQIDDVTVTLTGSQSYGGKKTVTLRVESPCPRCGAAAYGRDLSLREADPDTDRGAWMPELVQQTFLKDLGDRLKDLPLCWNCKADVGDVCGSCRRAFTAEVWAKEVLSR